MVDEFTPSGDSTASGDRAVRATLENAALTLPQQRRLDELRERHHEITVEPGPGGKIEATVKLGRHKHYIYDDRPDELLDAVERALDADPGG